MNLKSVKTMMMGLLMILFGGFMGGDNIPGLLIMLPGLTIGIHGFSRQD